MKVLVTDGGRCYSKRPHQQNDCVVRSTSVLCGVGYDEAYDFWKAQGRSSHEGFDLETVLRRMHRRKERLFGCTVGRKQYHKTLRYRHSYGRKYWLGHWDGEEFEAFVGAHPRGRFFVLFQAHVSAVVAGEVRDTMVGLSYALGPVWSYYKIGPKS